jgi:hypothetical protein
MGPLDRWNTAIALVAAYFAVMAIVRLMTKRRDLNVTELERQIATLRKQPKPKRPAPKTRDAA